LVQLQRDILRKIDQNYRGCVSWMNTYPEREGLSSVYKFPVRYFTAVPTMEIRMTDGGGLAAPSSVPGVGFSLAARHDQFAARVEPVNNR